MLAARQTNSLFGQRDERSICQQEQTVEDTSSYDTDGPAAGRLVDASYQALIGVGTWCLSVFRHPVPPPPRPLSIPTQHSGQGGHSTTVDETDQELGQLEPPKA
ncbi:hypothetical protein E4U54_000848 [Claviceps lovelessii]|nr:hypothetical protein E4U54_000848 [Claviceps lovelessii]